MPALPEAPAAPRIAPLSLHVDSETGPLRQVIVHTPGEEMHLVSPENKLELLFDDILFTERAEEEHAVMCALFRRVVNQPEPVLQLADLLRDVFEIQDAREEFVSLVAERMAQQNVEAYEAELRRLSPPELLRFALTGASPLPLVTHPLPNLMFTRDLSAVVGNHIILSHAATLARARESIIVRIILHYHERFAGDRARFIELPPPVSFEGGDLLVASEKVVLIGNSERTSLGGVTAVAKELLQRTPVEHVVMVNLPKARYCMHLDTVFTFASPTECVVFPPVIEGHPDNVLHFTEAEPGSAAEGRFHTQVWPNLKAALEGLLDREMTFIRCGGEEEIHQRREQWTDGANLFALAPGLVVGYERNQRTYDALREHGYHVVEAEAFLAYHAGSPFRPGQKVAIRLRGHELSRGRGGPRCMTLPLVRESLDGAAA
ncbi:MAG: arginine deiminase family protein [Rhodothermales bacterium]|nr:arginine deiminase family protein [Rhodothermales bacterium]